MAKPNLWKKTENFTGIHSGKALITLLVILVIGGGGGFLLSHYQETSYFTKLFSQIRPRRENGQTFKFINPLLGYILPESINFNQYQPLEKKIADYISQAKSNNQATDVSVYFRDLAHGRWVGFNENEQYAPASMLKVVIMIAYYNQAQNDPSVLNRQLLYSKNMDDNIQDVPFQTPSSLQVGKNYTVEQLIEAMIINSDNGAKNLLLSNIDQNHLDQVYNDLSIQNPDNVKGDYVISAENYSLFLSILYNATYLNPDLSEKALNLLSQAKYNDGLVAGVPNGTTVAQKFGEHVNTDSAGQAVSVELHDCGIIYASNNPYILCVMTKNTGANINSLASIIKSISNIAYTEINKK